jgi:hypothetical protein
MIRLVMESFSVFPSFPIIAVSLTKVSNTNTWVERFNVQGSGLMNPNRLNPKELRLHRGGK